MKRNVAALIDFLDSRHGKPHQLGRERNDCAAFCLDAVEAQTGVRVAPKLKWVTLRGVVAIIKRYGSLEAAFDAHFERIEPALAKRGDIGAVPDKDFGIHPMIVEGPTLVGPGDKGNRRVKRSAMVTAWSATGIK